MRVKRASSPTAKITPNFHQGAYWPCETPRNQAIARDVAIRELCQAVRRRAKNRPVISSGTMSWRNGNHPVLPM